MTPAKSLAAVIDARFRDRPSRAPRYRQENSALVKLADAMSRAPSGIFQGLVQAVLDLTRAESAGISLLDTANGKFVWPAVGGAWAEHVGGGTPRAFSPCGTVLDRDEALLFVRPARHFGYLVDVQPPVEEGLLVPFHIDGVARGTLWGVTHTAGARFDPEDERVITSLSRFTAAAYRTLTDSGSLDHLG